MSDRFDHRLEHRLESKPADSADDAVTTVRRIELITGTGRRRQWSDDDKVRIIVESLKPGANVSEVARRHGLSPQQLFGWRREARALMAEDADAPEPEQAAPSAACRKRGRPKVPGSERSSAACMPAFAPVVIAASATSSPAPAAPPSPPADTAMSGLIEIAIGDAIVRVRGQVEIGLLMAVLRAVRRA
jgi:transposase